MASLRLHFLPKGGVRMTLIDKIGKLWYLDPRFRVIINSSVAHVCEEDGEPIAEIPWKQDVRFQEWTGNVSKFLIRGGRLFVKNCLQELVDPSKPEDDGKVFGGEPGFILVEEANHDSETYGLHTKNTWDWSPKLHASTPDMFRENLSVFVLGLHRLGVEIDPHLVTETLKNLTGNTFIESEVHYTEWKEVQPGLKFSDTTFVFNQEGFQIHPGNVLIKPQSELHHPSHAETWNQEVLHSELDLQEQYLKPRCLVELFLEDLEWKYLVYSRDLAQLKSNPDKVDGVRSGYPNREMCLYEILSNIMDIGWAFSDSECECYASARRAYD